MVWVVGKVAHTPRRGGACQKRAQKGCTRGGTCSGSPVGVIRVSGTVDGGLWWRHMPEKCHLVEAWLLSLTIRAHKWEIRRATRGEKGTVVKLNL